MLAENIEIPEVPTSDRTIAAHKKRVAALKRAKAKRKAREEKRATMKA
jgi:hypothetical protein